MHPVVCVDERPCFLIGDVLTPIPIEPGKVKREHYEYEKNGSCSVFMAVEPLTGKRFIKVYKRRTGKEYSQFMEYLAQQYPNAKKIRIVQDNLSTHSTTMFYAHLKPETAFALAQRFEMHYTPAKSSWLNMAEIELSALARQCLNRRIGTQEKLESEVKVWVAARNKAEVKIKWQFSIADARDKFKNKYPLEQLRQKKHKKIGA
jgi:DDE superfamily endonuclease